ncbi:hypothetical protein I316_01197 [Kwoniella heveanensis BCC8398]|uniref:Xeroderma pigmentosum group C-complementing protein n=1 Tax=Kwoniella heveanensis BCC8398 TaxID=1296120 RepID=A0A1B9H1Y1_9TREE|nr:hypothetical protein I316_01197 [Kwoniella heveanensis BCC8398]
MSASRPKSSKVIQRPPTIALPKQKPKATPNTPKTRRPPVPGDAHVTPNSAVRRPLPPAPRSGPSSSVEKGKGKAKAPPPSEPITISSDGDEEDEDDDFEEVPIPSAAGPSSPYPGTPTTPGTNLTHGTTPGTVTTAPSIDDDFGGYGEESGGDDSADENDEDGVIHLELGGETAEDKAKRIALAMRKKPMTAKDRAIRLEIHKMHVIALLASAGIRNRWLCNGLLKARLLSLLPHPLQAAFNIPPSRFPDRAQRSRLFFDALQSLVTWWSQSFFDISDPTIGLRTRSWDEVQEIIDQLPKLTRADLTPGHFIANSKEKAKERQDALDQMSIGSGEEKLRSVNSLMKKALQQEGSRDVSAQLFVSLARACGLGARLVVSLQPVPWRAEKVVQKKKPGAGRGGRSLASRQGMGPESDGDDDEEEDEFEEVPIPGSEEKKTPKSNVRAAGVRRLQDPADLYRLRPSKPAPQKVGTPSRRRPKTKQDLTDQPPVFWAEIFSRSDQRWIPVDPVRGTIRKKNHFEPSTDSGPIRLLYVVAFEEDGHARDVTLRYTKNFGAKTVKLRVPAKKDEPDWWETVMGFLQREYRLNRDELEDAELENSQISESMPLHMNGFKDHPIYVLERHLKREEVIQPKREIGRFKGEPVYRRANVVSCRTAETWMRTGRRVKDKQEPLKWVKQRAVTLQKRRAQELAVQEGGEAIQQGLYAEYQTEIYRPPPIKDGIIPQNSFGNIDLYAPTMLPEGAVHLPYKGIAKVAKNLEISYAEACTGFEFKKQRAIPVINGIVVAAENETLVMDAYAESAAAAEEKERMKKEERGLKRWAKLINGLRVRLRLQAEYGTGEELNEASLNPLADPAAAPAASSGQQTKAGPGSKTAASVLAEAHKKSTAAWAKQVRDRSESPKSEVGGVEDIVVAIDPPAPPEDMNATENAPGSEPTKLDRPNAETRTVKDGEYLFKPRMEAVAPEPESDSDIEAVEQPPSSGRATRITLRLNGTVNSATKTATNKATAKPTRRNLTRAGRKRKAGPPISEEEEEEGGNEPPDSDIEMEDGEDESKPVDLTDATSTRSRRPAATKSKSQPVAKRPRGKK